jgi:hypothetical protein
METARKGALVGSASPARAPPAKTAAKPSAAAAMRRQLGNAGMRAAIGQQKHKGEAPGKKAAGKGGGKPALKLVAGKGQAGDAAGGPAAVAQGADPAAGGAGKAMPAAVAMHMPEPPARPSPATMKRIAGTKARAGDTASAQAALPDAGKQVGAARDAVVAPEAERAAQAQAQLIADMNAAPSPEIEKLCERIREVIRNKRPPDEDALAAAEPSKEAMDAGNQLNSTVKDETGKVQENYDGLNKPPAVPGAPDNPGLSPQPPAAATASINANAATPDAVPPQNVSLDKDAADSKAKIENAGMEKPSAQLVQSGPIAEAREAQGELNQTAQESPAQVLAKQKETLGAAKADMAALGADALAALSASRTAGVQKAEGQQGGMVQSEDQMRTNAGIEAKAAFSGAQTAVDGLLKGLTEKAMAEWEAAKTIYVSDFKADLKIVEDRVKERHSGVGGWFVGVWDAVTGLPGWAEDAYSKAENRFAESVIAKIKEISTKVNAIILACEKIITDARTKIKGIYDKLPASLQGWASGEQAKFASQLDKLQQQATSTRDNFNKGLVQQAASAVDEVRAEIADLRKKAGGLIGRIAAAVNRFLDDPVKFIIDGLLELVGIPPAAFWALVAKIKKVAADIADNPKGFANNLLKGLGQGFTQFFDNFGSHLIKGFLTWLLGDLKGVQVPKDLSLKSIATFFLQLMGITWPNIREILSRKIGPKNLALIEKAYSILSLLIEKGPEGIYEMIKEKLDPQAIVDQVIEMAVDYMVTAIAKNVATRLLLLFNPVGAIAQAIEAIYRVLKWIFQNAARIFRLIEAVVNGLADIVAGNVGGFANAVEKALGMLIAPVIGFIADYCNLGDLPQVVARQIKSFQKMVLGFIEKAIDWIIDKGKALLAAVGIGGKKDEKKGGDSDIAVGENVPFTATGEQHHLWVEMHGNEGVLMVASVKQSLDKFFTSKKVTDGITKDKSKQLGKDVKEASDLANKTKQDINALTKEVQAVQQEKAASAGKPDLAAKNDTVKTDERLLAEVLVRIFEALDFPEPIAGLHPVTRTKAPFATWPEESHHAPPKAATMVLKAMLASARDRVVQGAWLGDPDAQKVSDALEGRRVEIDGLYGDDGVCLSAILISYEAHKGAGGAHSSDNAGPIAAMASGNDAILVALRSSTRKIAGVDNAVSVNPRTAGWMAFLGDVHLWNQNRAHETKPNQVRVDHDVVEMAVGEAQKNCTAVSRKNLQDHVIQPINNILANTPQKALEYGLAPLRMAMETVEEGTPTGRRQALLDLVKFFATSYGPVRQPIRVTW